MCKMYLVLFLTVALLGDCRSANVNFKHINLMGIYNTIEDSGLPTKPRVARKFLTITRRPEASYTHEQGTTLAISCDALGTPAPSVRWFKNDEPVYEYDLESHEQIESNPTSVARITSTLLVTKSSIRDEYTCLASAGTKTARASTVVYTYSTDGSTELSERSKLYPLAPRIIFSYKVYVDTIGNKVVLPCRVKGHPRPKITWKDNKGNVIKNDPRMKVLRSGELVISTLQWTDMGQFGCQAVNIFGTQTVKTFIYPAKAG